MSLSRRLFTGMTLGSILAPQGLLSPVEARPEPEGSKYTRVIVEDMGTSVDCFTANRVKFKGYVCRFHTPDWKFVDYLILDYDLVQLSGGESTWEAEKHKRKLDFFQYANYYKDQDVRLLPRYS